MLGVGIIIFVLMGWIAILVDDTEESRFNYFFVLGNFAFFYVSFKTSYKIRGNKMLVTWLSFLLMVALVILFEDMKHIFSNLGYIFILVWGYFYYKDKK